MTAAASKRLLEEHGEDSILKCILFVYMPASNRHLSSVTTFLCLYRFCLWLMTTDPTGGQYFLAQALRVDSVCGYRVGGCCLVMAL